MDPRQKARDLILLLKRDRKAQVLAGVFILLLIWGIMGDANPRRTAARNRPEPQVNAGNMGADEAYRDLITRFSADLEVVKETTIRNAEKTSELRQNIEQYEERTAEIFKKIIERMADLEAGVANANNQFEDPIDVVGEPIGDIPADSLQPFGDLDEAEVAPPKIPVREKIAMIGAGDSVKVKLLAGVNAPTDGTPYPVIFKLVDDVTGPDGSTLPLGEARLIAAAQGSLSDQRALFRLTNLNVRLPDGSRQILEVDGWIVGEDGIRGMEGILIDPLGKAIFGSAFAGALQGAGDSISSRNVTINSNNSSFAGLDENIGERAIAGGLGRAGDRWAQFIDDRASLLVPHVKVLSGRVATAVFSQSVLVPELYDQLEEQEYAFTGMD